LRGYILNKLGLIQELKEKCHLTRDEASKVVEVFFGEMAKAFVKGERVEIRGLCSFHIKDYAPYTGRNPKTGEKVQIPAKKLPFFKCGKELKERVNYLKEI
jgi:integration host factor subunit beta